VSLFLGLFIVGVDEMARDGAMCLVMLVERSERQIKPERLVDLSDSPTDARPMRWSKRCIARDLICSACALDATVRLLAATDRGT
jgi:hypothetical protein